MAKAILRVARAARRLAEAGAFLEAEPAGDAYVVRKGADRRRGALMRIGETEFRILAADFGLAARPDGGWRLSRLTMLDAIEPSSNAEGPSRLVCEQSAPQPEGGRRQVKVNLGESPIAWLARRKDASGQPWLTPAEALAAERLRETFEQAGLIGRLTMDWTARPRRGAGGGVRFDPMERALQARSSAAAALEAVGHEGRALLLRVCCGGSALEAAERDLGLKRRTGKLVLKAALGRLARHYRLA
jgi:Domain of unknown function (DUF6456)